MIYASQQVFYAGLALGCASLAAVTDVRERRIPNTLTGTAAALGILLHTLWGGWGGLAASLEAGLLAGVLFFALHVAGGMGAGDVKLMFAIGSLVGLASLGSVLLCTALSGGVVAIAFCLGGGRLRQRSAQVGEVLTRFSRSRVPADSGSSSSDTHSLSIPYALPVAAGCLLNLAGRVR